MQICLNGNFVSEQEAQLSPSDGGFLYGDTLFETLKAHGENILLVKEHLDRLELSARLLNFPCQRKRIEIALQQLAKKLATPASRIRLTISRGDYRGLTRPEADQGWFLLTATPITALSNQDRTVGAECVTAPNRRVNPLSHLPQMKRGNYADCLYAAEFARQRGAREALFADPQGNILEGCTSNIFAIIDDRLVTPPAGALILAGVMRQQVIQTAEQIGLALLEKPLQPAALLQAEEVFLTNSIIDILPINRLDGQPLNRGENWRSILKKTQMRIEA